MTNGSFLKTRSAGFTLLEVLTVCVIVGILAAIALPSYSDYVKRGQIQDGTSVLADAQVRLEQYYQDYRTYADVSATILHPCPTATTYFTYDCTPTATPTLTFLITATGRDNVLNFNYTLNQAGVKGSTTPWASGAQPCWIMKKGDTC